MLYEGICSGIRVTNLDPFLSIQLDSLTVLTRALITQVRFVFFTLSSSRTHVSPTVLP
jgi:hypothetical protein